MKRVPPDRMPALQVFVSPAPIAQSLDGATVRLSVDWQRQLSESEEIVHPPSVKASKVDPEEARMKAGLNAALGRAKPRAAAPGGVRFVRPKVAAPAPCSG